MLIQFILITLTESPAWWNNCFENLEKLKKIVFEDLAFFKSCDVGAIGCLMAFRPSGLGSVPFFGLDCLLLDCHWAFSNRTSSHGMTMLFLATNLYHLTLSTTN